MEQKIKFTCYAIKWFDKVNGNTYHSVKVTKTKSGEIITHPKTYGYGDHYRQTALEIMLKAGWLPKKYTKKDIHMYERENNYPIDWNVKEGLKRECIANAI